MTEAVKFQATPQEALLVANIVTRAVEGEGYNLDPVTLEMDLVAAHANGCPLDFEKLLEFDAFNFAHDVLGISRHLDRSTGKLERFLPRCAKPDPAPEPEGGGEPGWADQLGMFTGTEAYHVCGFHRPRLLLTDGAKFLADSAQCYWLMDLIGTHGPLIMAEGFALVKLERDVPPSLDAWSPATFIVEDGNENELYRERIPFTDFPLERYELFVTPADATSLVAMLKSEY